MSLIAGTAHLTRHLTIMSLAQDHKQLRITTSTPLGLICRCDDSVKLCDIRTSPFCLTYPMGDMYRAAKGERSDSQSGK